MANRNDATDLAKIVYIPEDIDPDFFLTSANVIVNDKLSGGVSGKSPPSDPMLKQIELYLAAHLLTLTTEKGALIREKMGQSEDEMADIYSAGLQSTRFGQMALMLDSSGTLAQMDISGSAGGKAVFRFVGSRIRQY
jgi:hypothetical protein